MTSLQGVKRFSPDTYYYRNIIIEKKNLSRFEKNVSGFEGCKRDSEDASENCVEYSIYTYLEDLVCKSILLVSPKPIKIQTLYKLRQ